MTAPGSGRHISVDPAHHSVREGGLQVGPAWILPPTNLARPAVPANAMASRLECAHRIR